LRWDANKNLANKNFSGASRRSLENKRGIPSIVFLNDEREENFQQKIILVTEKFLFARF
jgi:hypothetical protein